MKIEKQKLVGGPALPHHPLPPSATGAPTPVASVGLNRSLFEKNYERDYVPLKLPLFPGDISKLENWVKCLLC